MSRPESRTLNYLYYGFAVRKEIATKIDGLSLDYVYPGCDGQMSGRNSFEGIDYKGGTVPVFHEGNRRDCGFLGL
jgi:hypothetical protein